MAEKKPNIRFKGFEEEWEKTTFANEAETRRGLTYSPSNVNKNGVRVLRSSNISDDTFVISDEDVFVDENAINIDFAKNEDILITSANGSQRLVGKHCLINGVKENSTVHGGFMLLATAKNPYFLNASMGSSWYHDFIKFFVAGGNGAIGNLNKADLDSYEIKVPSQSEQQKIGEFFKQLDELIGAKEQELEKLRQIKLALLDKMFPSDNQENVNGGGKSLIYSVLQNDSQLVVASPTPNTPTIRFRGFTEPWKKKKLSSIIELNGGLDYKHLSPGNIPVYGTGGYMLSVDKALSYEKDAIGIGRKGTIDKPYILYAPFWTVDTLFYAIPKVNQDLNFCFCLFQNVDWKKHDESTGVPSLSKTVINSVEVYTISNYEEQRKIGEFFRSQDEAIASSQLQINKLKNIKQACLSLMFA